MCRARFGVLNNLYEELINEGINDVKFMGINGYNYIEDSYSCMICDEPDDCSNCENVHTIPWAQEYDDGSNCQQENVGLCEGGDEDGDIWDLWDISSGLRSSSSSLCVWISSSYFLSCFIFRNLL